MAKSSKTARKSVKSAMHRKKKGTLRSGKAGKGGRVKSKKQAIAIGLSEARERAPRFQRRKSNQAFIGPNSIRQLMIMTPIRRLPRRS